MLSGARMAGNAGVVDIGVAAVRIAATPPLCLAIPGWMRGAAGCSQAMPMRISGASAVTGGAIDA